jgi:hypothetical protein
LVTVRLKFWSALLPLLLVLATAFPAVAQDAERDATRAKLATLLTRVGARSDVNTTFSQSTKNPYNFIGSMTSSLVNSQSLEIVISVTKSQTIGFRVYPHYKGQYINLGRAKDPSGLMRSLLRLSDDNFLFWGADDTADVFSGYTITLESGFPEDAITIVMRSIRNTDKFVGQLRPFYDGTTGQ